MSDELTYEEWQKHCADLAKRLLNIEDLLDEDDPHELFDVMEDYYDEGSTPTDFIREVFSDELDDDGLDELSRLSEEGDYLDEEEDEDFEDEDEDSDDDED